MRKNIHFQQQNLNLPIAGLIAAISKIKHFFKAPLLKNIALLKHFFCTLAPITYSPDDVLLFHEIGRSFVKQTGHCLQLFSPASLQIRRNVPIVWNFNNLSQEISPSGRVDIFCPTRPKALTISYQNLVKGIQADIRGSRESIAEHRRAGTL